MNRKLLSAVMSVCVQKRSLLSCVTQVMDSKVWLWIQTISGLLLCVVRLKPRDDTSAPTPNFPKKPRSEQTQTH